MECNTRAPAFWGYKTKLAAKDDEMLNKPHISSIFLKSFNVFNITWPPMLDSLHHGTFEPRHVISKMLYYEKHRLEQSFAASF